MVERGPGKSFWVRIGAGFTNRDGSMNLHLDALPINGKLQVREWEPDRRMGEAPGPEGGAPRRPRPATDPAADAVF